VPSVLSLDTNILENGRQHRTERFELVQREGEKARLVVRRGQGFIITLSLTRPFNPYTDAMSFIFTFSGELTEIGLDLTKNKPHLWFFIQKSL